MDKEIKNIEVRLKDQLELPRAILLQLRETCLFNSIVDEAIRDIDVLLEKGQEK